MAAKVAPITAPSSNLKSSRAIFSPQPIDPRVATGVQTTAYAFLADSAVALST